MSELPSILIVDDTPDNIRVLVSLLKGDYRTVVATDGPKALEQAAASPAPTLILLDVMMPEMDGYEVLQRLKADPATRDIPVIFITAMSAVEDEARGLEHGAVDYITKPFNSTIVKARVRTHVSLSQLQSELRLQKRAIEEKNRENEQLLLNILPSPIAERLKSGQRTIADNYPAASVLFADIVGFTNVAAELHPEEILVRLNAMFSAFDALTRELGVEKIKTIGDCYMAVAGVPEQRDDHAVAAAELALGMVEAARESNRDGEAPFKLRIGLHTGPVVAGVIGTSKFAYDMWGDTVNIASRMESTGLPGAIQLTEAARNALSDRYLFETRGVVEVKGKGSLQTYLLTGRQSP